MNKCILIGNLTRDPETTVTGNGISVCRFAIAVSRNYTNANGEREADFINIVAWRGLADNCGKYLVKGSKVAVSGALQTRSYEDKEGNKRTATEIVVDDVQFLNSKPNGEQANTSSTTKPAQRTLADLEPVMGDDLPF